MASTTFVDYQAPTVNAAWLNDVNTLVYVTYPAFMATTVPNTLVSKDSGTGAAALPAGTTAQRPTTPAAGYARYNTTTAKFEGYTGSTWSSLGGGATGGGSDAIFNENSTTMTASYTLTTGKNAMTVGPLNVGSGLTLTVPSGQRLVVL